MKPNKPKETAAPALSPAKSSSANTSRHHIVVKKHIVKGNESVSYPVAVQFITNVKNNDLNAVARQLEHDGQHLATLRGNYFPLPLFIAGKNRNIKMMNYLVNQGADVRYAIKHPHFRLLPLEAQTYLRHALDFTNHMAKRARKQKRLWHNKATLASTH